MMELTTIFPEVASIPLSIHPLGNLLSEQPLHANNRQLVEKKH